MYIENPDVDPSNHQLKFLKRFLLSFYKVKVVIKYERFDCNVKGKN